jgi:hypothetical protein
MQGFFHAQISFTWVVSNCAKPGKPRTPASSLPSCGCLDLKSFQVGSGGPNQKHIPSPSS